MKKFLKGALKFIAIFSFVTVTFYIIVFSQIKLSFYYPNSLSYEHHVFYVAESAVFNFCGIFHAYLGLRFIKRVLVKELRVYQKALAGVILFAVGYLSSRVGPAFFIGMICNTAGDYLLNCVINAYGAENELTGNMKLIFCLMMICISSITFALMCYDAAENYYTGARVKAKRENEQLQESKNDGSEEESA